MTRILRSAATEAGFQVVEYHYPVWEKDPVKDTRYFRPVSLIGKALGYCRAAWHLNRVYRRDASGFTAYLVGFQGSLDVLLLRMLRPQRPLLFAPLTTITETMVEDRAWLAPRSWLARLLRWLDRKSLSVSDLVIVDTQEHARYLQRTFGISEERLAVFYLGPDWSAFHLSEPPPARDELKVLFFGSFLPLHGVRTILEAAERLPRDRGIHFTLCGNGWEYARCRRYTEERQLAQVAFVPWVPYQELQHLIASHDVCLGIFDNGTKARMVIPNKIYQSAAVGRPVVTADTPAVREVFSHGEDIWLVRPRDAQALADALEMLARDRDVRLQLGSRAARLMEERFSVRCQGARFRDLVWEAGQQ